MSNTVAMRDPRKDIAAQNAQDGVVTVLDLSVLTGISVPQLTKFAKSGMLEHFGEYHGKRFYNFQTIVEWAFSAEGENEAKIAIRKGLEMELDSSDCPYSIENNCSNENTGEQFKISWKVATPA